MKNIFLLLILFLFNFIVSCDNSSNNEDKTIIETFISAQDLKSKMNKMKLNIVDVRTEKEYYSSVGHIDGSRLIPLKNIANTIEELKNIEEEVFVVCLSGKRSSVAAKILRDNGIKARNMRGGMLAWNKLK